MTADLRSVKHDQRFSYWIEKVRECRKSGLTVKEWCLQNGCNPSTYYKWQRLIFQGFQENSVSETVCTVADTASNCTDIVSATTNDCTHTVSLTARKSTGTVSDIVLKPKFAALKMSNEAAPARNGSPSVALIIKSADMEVEIFSSASADLIESVIKALKKC